MNYTILEQIEEEYIDERLGFIDFWVLILISPIAIIFSSFIIITFLKYKECRK